MRNPFGNRHRAREEALAWLARLRRGLRQGEGPELLAWLRRRSHRTIIAKAAVEWYGAEVVAILSEIFPIAPAILNPRRGPQFRIMVAAAALSVCVTMLPAELGGLARLGLLPQEDPWYSTTLGATRRLALEDGSHIALNRGTRVSVMMAEHSRSAFVARGEVLFSVARQPYRPFDVRAAGRNFETTGATFDIRLAGPDSVILTVLGGVVTVFPPSSRMRLDESWPDPTMGKPIRLGAFQLLRIEADGEFGKTLTQQEAHSQLSWAGGT